MIDVRRMLGSAALGAFLVAACSPSHERATPAASSSTIAIVLPDVSGLSESVQKQIRDRHDALARTLARPDASSKDRAEAYAALGRLLMAAKFNDQAAACFTQARAIDPTEARWPYFQGHAYLRKGDRAQAAEAFEQAIKLHPDDLPSLIWLGETYLDDDRLESAETTFKRALVIQPQSAPALFGAGRTALARRNFAEAVQDLERALAADPRASAIQYPLAMAYRAVGEADKADAHLRQRGGSYPTFVDPLMQDDEEMLESAVSFENRGMQALRSGDFASAIATFRKGLTLDPADVSIRYWLGAALYASGDADGAVREFSDVIGRDPSHAKAHFSLGAVYDARHDRQHALDEYRKAVRADPNLPEARVRLAEDLREAGNVAESMEHYRAAVKLDPNQIEAWVGGERALVALQRYDEARRWLDEATRLFPDQPALAGLRSALNK